MGHYLLDLQEDQRRIGMDLAAKVGAIKFCPAHGHAIQVNSDLEAAYRLANALWSQGKIEAGVFSTRREMTDSIKSAFEDASIFGCPHGDCPVTAGNVGAFD